MGTSLKFSFLILTIFASMCGCFVEEDGFSPRDGGLYLNDVVIIDAARTRVRRGAINGTSSAKQSLNQAQLEETAFGRDCKTSVGKRGMCRTFRECYPLLKVAELGAGGWLMGHYDSCSYVGGDNTEVFGVCCTEPVGTPPQTTPDVQRLAQPLSLSANTGNLFQGISLRQIPAGWPPALPPLPTHPPDHTAPTHPPLFIAGIPGYPTRPPSTQRPVQYPTYPPSTARPITTTTRFTTRPPWALMDPVSTEAPASAAVDGSCGQKNGIQSYEGVVDPDDSERIVGGHNADLGEWPWIAVLFNGGRQFCGGSLIDDVHVLSAAHCIAHMTSWDVARLTVRLGDYNIHSNVETRHVERRVKRIVRHRGFDMRTLHNDISILTLDQPVQFSQNVRPVCLPSGGRAYNGALATVIGWGSLRESGPQPSVLQEVSIPVWTNQECRLKYGAAAPGGITESMLCAGRAAMDSCSGDSGGPLMVNEGGRWTQVGVVSWGIGCGKGQYPGVYTRVTSFLPWIQKNTMR